jgi:hypothetical protein
VLLLVSCLRVVLELCDGVFVTSIAVFALLTVTVTVIATCFRRCTFFPTDPRRFSRETLRTTRQSTQISSKCSRWRASQRARRAFSTVKSSPSTAKRRAFCRSKCCQRELGR